MRIANGPRKRSGVGSRDVGGLTIQHAPPCQGRSGREGTAEAAPEAVRLIERPLRHLLPLVQRLIMQEGIVRQEVAGLQAREWESWQTASQAGEYRILRGHNHTEADERLEARFGLARASLRHDERAARAALAHEEATAWAPLPLVVVRGALEVTEGLYRSDVKEFEARDWMQVPNTPPPPPACWPASVDPLRPLTGVAGLWP